MLVPLNLKSSQAPNLVSFPFFFFIVITIVTMVTFTLRCRAQYKTKMQSPSVKNY